MNQRPVSYDLTRLDLYKYKFRLSTNYQYLTQVIKYHIILVTRVSRG
jgi:hypothetical protein